MDTQQQFKQAMAGCRDIFKKKLHDYGAQTASVALK